MILENEHQANINFVTRLMPSSQACRHLLWRTMHMRHDWFPPQTCRGRMQVGQPRLHPHPFAPKSVIELQCQTGVARLSNGNAMSLASINYLPCRSGSSAPCQPFKALQK